MLLPVGAEQGDTGLRRPLGRHRIRSKGQGLPGLAGAPHMQLVMRHGLPVDLPGQPMKAEIGNMVPAAGMLTAGGLDIDGGHGRVLFQLCQEWLHGRSQPTAGSDAQPAGLSARAGGDIGNATRIFGLKTGCMQNRQRRIHAAGSHAGNDHALLGGSPEIIRAARTRRFGHGPALLRR